MAGDKTRTTPLVLGEWLIDGNALTASRGDEVRAIEPRAYKVLCYLAERPGQLVTIDELLDAHWAGTVVTPNAVTRVIAHLRKVLDDDAKNPRYIETVARTGYRCIAAVAAPDKSSPHNRNWVAAAVLVLAAVAAILYFLAQVDSSDPSVAVLPFDNLTGDASLEYLGEGVSEEIVGTLTRLPGVHVSARTESFRYRGAETSELEIAEALGVSYLVAGSIQRNNNDLRIHARLVDPATGSNVWSMTLERDIAQLFDGQQVVSRGIATALTRESSLDVEVETAETAPDSRAYDLYMRGRYIWHRRGNEPLQPAIDMMLEAVTIDPDFAKGWNALAQAYLTYPNYSPKGYRTWNLAEDAARKALDLDPDLSESYSVLAVFAYTRFQWQESESLYLEGIRKNPRSATAHYWYGQYLQVTGRLAKAAEQLRRTVELDPTYLPPRVTIAFLHLDAGSHASARRRLNDAWQAGYTINLTWMGAFFAAVLDGDQNAAEQWIDESTQDGELKTLLHRFVAVEFGATDEALGNDLSQYFWRRANYALGFWLNARLGNYEHVFSLAHERLDRNLHLEIRPFWSPDLRITEQPGFLELAERIGLIDFWKSTEWPASCYLQNDVARCDSSRISPELIGPILSPEF